MSGWPLRAPACRPSAAAQQDDAPPADCASGFFVGPRLAGVALLAFLHVVEDGEELELDAKLLRAGADPNAQDCNQRVPVHYALQNLTCLDVSDNTTEIYYAGKNPLLASVLLNFQAGLNMGQSKT